MGGRYTDSTKWLECPLPFSLSMFRTPVLGLFHFPALISSTSLCKLAGFYPVGGEDPDVYPELLIGGGPTTLFLPFVLRK